MLHPTLLLAFLIALHAAASEKSKPSPSPALDLAPRKVVNTDEPQNGGAAAELLKTTTTPEAIKPKKTGVNVSVTCTDENGRVLRSSEAGYDRCLSRSQTQEGQRPSAPGQPQGPNLNVNFGNH